MVTDPFWRYSCTYIMLELLYIWRLFSVLRLSVCTWGYLRPTYVRRHNVPVSVRSGRYIVVSEPRFTPGVGNHLGQCSGSYQQYNQIQIILVCIWIWGFQREYKNTMSLTIHSLTLFYSLITVVNQNIWFPSRFLFILLLPNSFT